MMANKKRDGDATATSPQYTRLRMMVIHNLNGAVQAIEREQWDELIRYCCSIITDATTLLLMGDDA